MKLDVRKKIELTLSNDAFFYIYMGEEPIDEDAIKEAKKVGERFPFGFALENDEWEYAENGGIKAVFIPYIPKKKAAPKGPAEVPVLRKTAEPPIEHDGAQVMSPIIMGLIKYTPDKSEVDYYWFIPRTGILDHKGRYKVEKNEFGLYYFVTGEIPGKGCMFYLKDFK